MRNTIISNYFDDRVRVIDFVLVYHKGTLSPAENEPGAVKSVIGNMGLVAKLTEEQMRVFRKQFEANLHEKEGLHLEYSRDVREGGLRFVKLHAPWEVLIRYTVTVSVQL